jgi:thiol-disulfide isomerase/thioredoxin
MSPTKNTSTKDASPPPKVNDWRVKLLGPYIRLNKLNDADLESPIIKLPTKEALNDEDFDYVALFFGADYCPHCKLFAPRIRDALPYFATKRVKLVFVSNDRSEEAFDASCTKNAGIDVVPLDTSKTRAMRDVFGIATIPALIILKNEDFGSETPPMIANGRHNLESDPFLRDFPWQPEKAGRVSGWDRYLIHGKYGKWYELGHHANSEKPDDIYMDEHAVRARAGILNIVTWLALMNIFFFQNHILVKVLFPLMAFEFLSSAVVGLTPIAPIGTLGTILAIILHRDPFWKPAKPKRFAWLVGLVLAVLCFTFFSKHEELDEYYKPLVTTVVFMCNIFTWLESSCGFCVGCFVYNNFLSKWFGWHECSECKL